MGTLFTGASEFTINGGTFNATTINISQSKRGIDLLMDWLATDAMHNSDELYDAPNCHPNTRVAVLCDIMKWVIECGVQDELMMWLFGPAGAGKSAIGKKIAELASEKGLLVGSFFFSRASSKRNTKDRLIPTLAYQMALSIPCSRTHIERAIETDPAIFHKDIQTQVDTLLMRPFRCAASETSSFPKLIIIDGLDECSDSAAQITILNAISRSFATHKLPIICLVISRPEIDLVSASAFNSNEPLKSIHRRLALDNNYRPDNDIRLFFSDNLERIRCSHRLKTTIPLPWPTEKLLNELVKKSSGQFIFAATVVRFVESTRHRPVEQLNIILGISPPRTPINPFAELDALYKQILSSVDDIQHTLHVLSFYASSPQLADCLLHIASECSEEFLCLEDGYTIDRALIDISSIVSYNESSGEVKILRASLVDFLSDKHRSDGFYIDIASAGTGFICRSLQYIKGPDGAQAGDRNILFSALTEAGWKLNDQLRSEILNFDLDAFIMAAIASRRLNAVYDSFCIWTALVYRAGLEDEDEELARQQYVDSFESRIQKYQSHWRLQLLLALALVMNYSSRWFNEPDDPERSRRLDILLEMDDYDLHLVDQDALDLRHSTKQLHLYTRQLLRGITSSYVNGHEYASAALHCMGFLSDPPGYSEAAENGSPRTGITYTEWKATCSMALVGLCRLLAVAKTSQELVQFLSDSDIDTTVRENFPLNIWRVDTHILAFLSRGGVFVNWRIVSAIQRTLSATDTSEQSEASEKNEWDMYESEEDDWDIYDSDENDSDTMSM